MDIFGIVHSIWNNYLIHIVDILIVTYIFYSIMLLIKGTRAVHALFGIIILVILTIFIRQVVRLKTLGWLLESFWPVAVVIIAVVFQPELRAALAQLGAHPLGRIFITVELSFINDIIPALRELSEKRIGALIVLEQEVGLRNFVQTGTVINGETSKELLLNIFHPRTVLHDGAVIIQGSRLVAAGCILPLSNNPGISKVLGMRHRASIGITEISDAIAIIVSEETGEISIAREGRLEQNIGLEDLKKRLVELYRSKAEKGLLRKTITNG
ncbi:MAG: TIGR00159 family protein [Elusimicrobia bacterium CG1_02_37_114]|nr:MAG: TIGR00159 family protein [Elusimicrobia bacterium CG1_02_37_114]PIZ12882.1 MAG: TIGR00159 family protein [Elusimicrobia bacterium CG_4_10_14_0_8_um_filter_37_32]